jgi:AcrR family transcriptional regulator
MTRKLKRADSDAPPAKRRYNSPLRQQQSAETRRRIVHAGAELVHGFHAWDWTNLTARAVGERAGVSERTVQRYFPSERQLRDAVLERLVEESGVDLNAFELGDFAAVTSSMFTYLASFAIETETVEDPSFASMDQRRREALLGAVARATPGWSDHDRESAAAVLDILWNQPPYERLIEAWGFDGDRAVNTITWLIELIEGAIREGRHPGSGE